jgi:L-fuculose-phosphate aldolase
MSDVIIRDKTEYHTRTTDEMERYLSLPPWSLRQKMALACRILAAEGPVVVTNRLRRLGCN